MKRKPIRQDLKHLFGEPVTSLAKIVGLESLAITPELMESVHDAADAMLTMRGQSERQRGYLAGLPFTVRLVLCMWLTDTELAAKLIRVAYSKA
jgi:hypothetical protein